MSRVPQQRTLRAAATGFGARTRHARILSRQFAKCCLQVHTAAGVPLQLRLVPDTPENAARLASEMAWLSWLQQRPGLSVPAPQAWRDGPVLSPPLRDADGFTWRAICCSWVPGRHLERGLTARVVADVGAAVAALHIQSASAPRSVDVHRSREWWIPRLCVLAHTLRDVVSGTITALPAVPGDVLAGLRRAHDALDAAGAALPRTAEHVGLIHTDVHPHNLRISRRGIGIVDFEDGATGRFMFDLACLWTGLAELPQAPRLLPALLAGYNSVRALPAEAMHDFRVMLAFRQFDLAGWVLSWPTPAQRTWGPLFLAQAPARITQLLTY
jgi:Ser/Thr protein kinase RdoA (MazF antagonist)